MLRGKTVAAILQFFFCPRNLFGACFMERCKSSIDQGFRGGIICLQAWFSLRAPPPHLRSDQGGGNKWGGRGWGSVFWGIFPEQNAFCTPTRSLVRPPRPLPMAWMSHLGRGQLPQRRVCNTVILPAREVGLPLYALPVSRS